MAIAWPRDAPAWACLVLALIALGLAGRRSFATLCLAHPRRVLLALAGTALLLSAGYLAFYLRGGPRIIDATSYWLEARGIARGLFSFATPQPSSAFRGRFLIPSPSGQTSVIFPPGYPALLALGFLARAPLAIGPILGALLVLATYALALRLFGSQKIALFAALLSTLCAALRYHTADTMSHGFAALLFAAAPLLLLTPGPRRRLAVLLAGVAIGWLVATRPLTGIVALVLSTLMVFRSERQRLPWLLIGLCPGLALLAAHQHAATGSFFGSTQLRYYALSDGPPGCFRYGFGQGIGCLHEHGDFVRENLPNGYGARAALGVMGRRLWLHASDIANAWPIAFCVPWAIWSGRRDAGVRLLGAGVVLLVLAYTPFYFDGNYPGGGARIFAEALPFEHVLVAWLASRVSPLRFVPALALGGFALHTVGYHRALAEREGGHPMFEPAVLERAGIRNGLVFVESDHGFNLGHVPGAMDAQKDLVVARRHEDARDFAVWNTLGRPPAFLYRRATDTPASVVTYQVPRSDVLEAEADWPPLSVTRGWVDPTHPSAACLAGSGALALHPEGPGPLDVELEVFAEPAGEVILMTRFVALADGPVAVRFSLDEQSWHASRTLKTGECWELEGRPVRLDSTPRRLQLSVRLSAIALDRVTLRRAYSKGNSVDN